MLRVGLNPYGLTYTLGLQGMGTARVNPAATGLAGFRALAQEIGARCVELDWRWLLPMNDDDLRQLGDSCRASRQTVLVSAWLHQRPGETLDDALRLARMMGAALLRLHLSPVLEGGRAALGDRWRAMAAHAHDTIVTEARKAADLGVPLGLENHQDFGSEELLAIAQAAGPHVGIVMDTGNPYAVGEDPVAFATRVAPRVRHLHLKDYRAQFTSEGFRLVRCAIGDGCVPLDDIVAALGGAAPNLTASLEPAALEARHIRLFRADWWEGYRPRDARELSAALQRLRDRAHHADEDARTPWERREGHTALVAYERAHLLKSVQNMRTRSWMPA